MPTKKKTTTKKPVAKKAVAKKPAAKAVKKENKISCAGGCPCDKHPKLMMIVALLIGLVIGLSM